MHIMQACGNFDRQVIGFTTARTVSRDVPCFEMIVADDDMIS